MFRRKKGKTKRSQSMPPRSSSSPVSSVDRRGSDPSPLRSNELQTNLLEDKIKQGGWLKPQQINLIHERLGSDTARQLMNETLESGHPSALATMANNLANPNFQPLGDNTAVVLGDGLRAWKRVEGGIDDMLTEAAETVDPPVVKLREMIHSKLLRNLQPDRDQGAALMGIIKDIANYARGRKDPLLQRLGLPLQDSQEAASVLDSLPLDLSRFNLPSDSVIAQAEGVLAQLRGQAPLVTLPTLANQGGDLPVVQQPDDRDSAAYQAIVQALRRRDQGNLLSEAERTELADVLTAARNNNKKVRIVTTNWNVLRVLWGLHPEVQPIPDDASSVEKDVNIEGARLEVRGVASPANPFPNQTQVGRLGSLNNPIAYGRAVRVTYQDGQTDDGYLYGYTPLGQARVLLDNGELLYTLSDNETVTLRNAPALASNVDIEHPRTKQWEAQSIRLENPGKIAADKYTRLLQYRDALKKLRTRRVANSPHQVDAYTNLMRRAGFKNYIVGGATRDVLIGKDPKDIDLASTMPALDAFEAIVRDPRGLGKKSGRQEQLEVRRNVPFGAVQVQPSDETGLDIISTHDTSGHGASLRLDFDALARDFTINAVYYDVDDDTLIDPTGRGLDDLLTRSVRFVQGTAEEVLSEEPVMVARWIKLMSKQDADGEFFKAATDDDVKTVLKWLLHYAKPENMEERVRARFVDRMTATPEEAQARVRRIFADVSLEEDENPAQAAVDAIRQIYGV